MNEPRTAALHRVWWRGWWRGLWTGLIVGLAVIGAGGATGILAMGTELSPNFYAISPLAIGLGACSMGAFMSVVVVLGTLAEHRQKPK